MDLEHIPPGEPERGDTGDVWSRLRASRERLAQQAIQEFPMPLEGLVVVCRKPTLDAYREATDPTKPEWERWAQLLIATCSGFRIVDSGELLADDHGQPVVWDTLARTLGVDYDPDLGAPGLVRDVFPSEPDMVDLAQRVDYWVSTAAADRDRDLEKGS